MSYGDNFDKGYWNVLHHIQKNSAEKNMTADEFIKKEIKRMKPQMDSLKSKDDFIRKLTDGAGPRD